MIPIVSQDGSVDAGILHDLKNLLAPLRLDCDLAIRRISPDSALHKHIQEIFHATQRAIALVLQLSSNRHILRYDIPQDQKGTRYTRASYPDDYVRSARNLTTGLLEELPDLVLFIEKRSQALLSFSYVEENLATIFRNIHQAASQILSLLKVGLPLDNKNSLSRPVDLNATITDTYDILYWLIGQSIHLDLKPDPDVGLVNVPREQIQRMLINLSINARDAMPDGGTLTIETAVLSLREESIRVCNDVSQYALLSVEDTGCGIGEDVRAHIFEPFFTTKKKGTGLGLAIVQNIVQDCGGHIKVESQYGHGASFRIYLPQIRYNGKTMDSYIMEAP